MSALPPIRTDVLIVGGGPCGLVLAIELGRRGVEVVLVDDKPGTAVNPQANATQARTMEHFRRLGFADEVRALGLPADHPTDIAYFTRYATHELARFSLPSASEARARVSTLGGSWSAAELPHRVSQKYVETVLRRHAAAQAGVSLHHCWRLVRYRDDAAMPWVEAEVEPVGGGAPRTVQARMLVGADGPRSRVRQQAGWRYGGESGVQRDFMGGRMYAIHLRAPTFHEHVPHRKAWMHVSFNADRRAFMAAVDGHGEFAFHTQLRPFEHEDALTEADALAMFQAAVGAPVPAEILSRRTWTAGHCLVAERFQAGRVVIGGDAAHLFTPTGGLGYNTAVDDAVNLGWKLAAVLHGQAGSGLLASYEAERRPLAQRNTAYAKGFADSLGLFHPEPALEEPGPEGDAARRRAGDYLAAHGRREFDIPGITFGGRYDGSPAIVPDGSAPPPDAANRYVQSACPGGRAPHLWLAEGVSLYDRFGFDWTLLRLDGAPPVDAFVEAAAAHRVRLEVLDVPGDAARALYEAPLALIRPDQIVAWRGEQAGIAESVFTSLLATPGQ